MLPRSFLRVKNYSAVGSVVLLMRRRSCLTSAGLGALAPLALASKASAAEWSAAEQANVKLVTDFCASWSTRDLKQVFPRFADTGVYRMSETTPAVTGHAGE